MAKKIYSRKDDPTRKRLGPKPIYDYSFPQIARQMMMLNPKTKQTELAEAFQVEPVTISTWKEKHPEFKKAIEVGKQLAAGRVVEALYQRALGYSHDEEKIFSHAGNQWSNPRVVRVRTRKHYPPDTEAATRILAAIQPDVWAPKSKHEHGGIPGGTPIGMRDETKGELINSILNMIHPKSDG